MCSNVLNTSALKLKADNYNRCERFQTLIGFTKLILLITKKTAIDLQKHNSTIWIEVIFVLRTSVDHKMRLKHLGIVGFFALFPV